MLERYSGLPAEAESASEFRTETSDRLPNFGCVYWSVGETADTVAAMQMAKDKGARLVTICNADGSQASRIADGTLYMRAGIEIGVASTRRLWPPLRFLTCWPYF
ncbi:MAG: hypothetical protein CM1200mP22_32980 [Dehalococcoidia bacterium]|nr:MAG: hypothetical protein CM1200mP22_32980 [Dehalococcoidia bacterium]